MSEDSTVSRTATKGLMVVAAVTALFAAGCGSSPSSSSSSSAGDGGGGATKTIGMSVPSLAESFWISMVYGVKDEAKKRGVKVIITSAGGDANANQQISQIQNLMQRKVSALIVGATDGDAVKPVVDQAAAQKIPVVGVSSTPNTDTLASSVYTDNAGMGQIQADCLGGAMGGKGQVGVLGGPAGQSWADMRLKGFTDTLAKKYPNVKVVAKSRLADNRNAALTTVQDWVQRFPQLTGIYSATDDVGSGAVDAMQAAHKLGEVKITSSNFSPAAEQLLKNGSFVCVSVQEIVEQGRQSVIQALNAIDGKPVKKTVITPVLKLTKANFASTDFGPIRAPKGFTP
jgi:ABC-type sugar transport system substrate-binding protein